MVGGGGFFRQLDYIYFAYGIFLAALFLVCFVLHSTEKDRTGKPSWLLLGLFGLTFALHEWLELVSFLFPGGWLSSGLEFLPIVVAFLFLLEFGRRGTPRLAGARAAWTLYGVLFLLVLTGLPYGGSGLKGSLRYFLALPAGLLAAWALFQRANKQPEDKRRMFQMLSVTVAVYALSTGAIVPKSGFALAGLFNNESFQQLSGFPVQLLRTVLVLVIAWLLGWYYAQSKQLGRRSFFGVVLALALLTTVGCGWFLTMYQGGRAALDMETAAAVDADGIVVHITGALQSADMTALDLAEYPALAAALASGKPADLDRVNVLLDQHKKNMRQATCYLLNKAGLTLASSNRAARDSFVGKSYAFRPYFTEALAGRPGKYFALGVTSGERGYYAGAPVADGTGRILGVVVVKSGVGDLLRASVKHPEPFLIDPAGVIFLSGNKDYLSRTLWPLTAEKRAALQTSRQFGAVSFEPLLEREPASGTYIRRAGRESYVIRVPIDVAGWSVVLLSETTSILIARLQSIGVTFIVSLVIMFAFVILMYSENALQDSLKLLALQQRNEAVLNEQLLLQQLVSEVNQTLQSTNAMADVLHQETEIVARHLGAAFARIWILNTATTTLELRASGGLYTHLDGAHASIPLGRGKIGQIAQEGRPCFTNTIIGDPGILDQEWARREGMQAFAGYPLLIGGRAIGVLALFARRPLNEAVRESLGIAASSLAVYIDRKRAEDALKESEERYRSVYTTAPLAFVLWDRETRVTDWNKQAEKLFGWTREEIIGEPFFDYIIPESSHSRVREIVELLLAGRLPSYSINENSTKSGRIIVCEWNNSIIRDADGNLAGVLSLGLDITERKQAEGALQEKTRQLEDLTQNLEQRVATEIAVRTRSEQMLVQQSKMAAMGEMLGAIAHQWRQPLNTLAMCVQNINDAFAQGDLDKSYLDRTILKSMGQIQHMSATIDDFRNFFLAEKERSRFDVMAAVGDVLSLLSAQLSSNNTGFRLTCHSHARSFEELGELEACPEKTIDGFRNEFGHVILNLIINAMDAITTRRELAPDEAPGRGLITFDFFNRDGTVVIEVGDNGSGIPEAIMDRIFEPYFTVKDPSKGTGIGLYMSKIMIEDHMKGHLTASNSPTGAVFSIRLPRAERTADS